MCRKVILFPFILLLTFAIPAIAREWSDVSGKFKTEAEFISFKNEKVYLEKADGQVIAVPLSQLSESDRAFLRSQKEVAEYLQSHPQLDPGAPEFATISAPDGFRSGEIRRFGDLGWSVKSMAFSPNGGMLAAGKQDDILLLFDLEKGQPLNKLEKLNPLSQLSCCLFSPDGTKLLAGGSTGRILVWEVDARGQLKPYSQFVGHNGEIHCMAVSSDGKHVVSGSRDKSLKYWKLENGQEVHSCEGFKGAVKACFITPNGKQALGADGDAMKLFDLGDGKQLQSMQLVNTSAYDVDISPDGRKVAACNNYEIRVWDTVTGEASVLQDREIQWSVQFSPDSRRIISGGRGKINLWDVESAKRISAFDTGTVFYVQALAYSPDNQHFAAIGSAAGQDIQVFRLPDFEP